MNAETLREDRGIDHSPKPTSPLHDSGPQLKEWREDWSTPSVNRQAKSAVCHTSRIAGCSGGFAKAIGELPREPNLAHFSLETRSHSRHGILRSAAVQTLPHEKDRRERAE